MSGSDLVAAFWRPLRAEVEKSGVSRRDLCERLRLSSSALSETLNGKRAGAPDWDLVRTVVEACGGQVDYWRRRLEELETDLARPAERRKQEENSRPPEPEPQGCPTCRTMRDGVHSEHLDWGGRAWLYAATGVLGDADEGLLAEMLRLGETEPRTAEQLPDLQSRFGELVRRLLAGLGRRARQRCHPHRVRFLQAAHTLVLIHAWVSGPFPALVLGADRLSCLATPFRHRSYHPVLGLVPKPFETPAYTDHRAQIAGYYKFMTEGLGVTGEPLARAALSSADAYCAHIAELAAECPELFVCTGMHEGSAQDVLAACPTDEARDRLGELHRELSTRDRGLDGLASLLRTLARDEAADRWPTRLSDIYRHELSRPISPVRDSGDGTPGLVIPQLGEGYVNPAFRVFTDGEDSRPHVDAWWNAQPLHEEIQGFLAGYLNGTHAAAAPLVILGDPGSGKSLLTRLLAAHLPPADYLPLRIELRNVPADAGVLEQIGHALRRATLSDDVTWDTVTTSSDGVLPVLIFDGFDELLQAGETDHWHYLDDIAQFQASSAANGRPVAAIVTSRTVVADQAHFPDHSVIVRLEPFDNARIARWTDVWNDVNRGSRMPALRRDLGSLHPELASQPLLLLLLALYYTVDREAAAADTTSMNRSTLYERLLRLFVGRQIGKLQPRLRPEALEERVETELDLLSVVAAAMFNRGRQGVSAEEAAYDIGLLRAPGHEAALSPAPLLFSRFFFIHEAKATYEDGAERSWYEFLHATFGEYLVARKIARTLRNCPDQGAYDGLLFALLSFVPLTDRARILDDLGDLLSDTAPVHALFPTALHGLSPASDTGYTMGRIPVTLRHACYSANLLLLALAPGRIIAFSDLAAGEPQPLDRWRSHATLWKSQFTATSWDAFTRAVGVVPTFRSGGSLPDDISLTLGHHDAGPTAPLLASVDRGTTAAYGLVTDALRRSRVLYDEDIELLVEPSFPLFDQFPRINSLFVFDEHGSRVSVLQALVALLFCDPDPTGDILTRYETCLGALEAVGRRTGLPVRVIGLVSRRLTADSPELPAAFVNEAIRTLTELGLATQSLDDAMRVSLLVCACRQLARLDHADGDLLWVIGKLLDRHEWDIDVLRMPTDLHHKAALSTGEVLTLLMESAEQLSPLPRIEVFLMLLKLAIALDQRSWCEAHAARLLTPLTPVDWNRLTPAEAVYLRTCVIDSAPSLARRLATEGAGRHP